MVNIVTWAATIVRNVGRPGDAMLAANLARDAARALGDPVMAGLAEFSRAHAAIGCGAYARGLHLAERAADDLDGHAGVPDAPEVLGMLHLTCAFAAAGLGDDPSGRLAEAEKLAARTGETTTLDLMFGPTNVSVFRVSMLADGRDPGIAVEIARSVKPALMPSINRQSVFYADTGRALARTRRDAEALRMLLTAERLAPQIVHTSQVTQETARALLDRVQQRATSTELRGFCERMGVLV